MYKNNFGHNIIFPTHRFTLPIWTSSRTLEANIGASIVAAKTVIQTVNILERRWKKDFFVVVPTWMWIVNRLILSPQSLVTNSWQRMSQGHTSLWMEEDILLDDLVNPAKSSSRHHRHQIHWTWSWAETRTSTHFSTGTLSHSSTFQDLRRLKLENPIFTSSVQSSMAIGTHTGFITISIFGSSMISVTLKIKTTLEAKFLSTG